MHPSAYDQKEVNSTYIRSGSGAKFQLATRYGKHKKHFLHYMVAIFNHSTYLHQSRFDLFLSEPLFDRSGDELRSVVPSKIRLSCSVLFGVR